MKRHIRHWIQDYSPKDGGSVTDPAITIGKAAELTGLSESTLRKYEAAGLILYARTSGGYRMLSQEDLFRIRIIQSLIKEKGLNLEGIRRLWALLPCWEFRECDESERAVCPVFGGVNEPCWVLFKARGGCDGLECRTCEVYRMAASCTEDLKKLVLDLLVAERRKKKPGE